MVAAGSLAEIQNYTFPEGWTKGQVVVQLGAQATWLNLAKFLSSYSEETGLRSKVFSFVKIARNDIWEPNSCLVRN